MVASLNASVNIAIPALSDADWQQACDYLAHRDRVLRKVIAQAPMQRWCVQPDAFAVLARAVVWQQLSAASAARLWRRFAVLPGALTAEGIAAMSVDTLRAAGLPLRKIGYLHDIAAQLLQGDLDMGAWQGTETAAITEQLVAVRGLGQWEASMFLIFCMGRPDVLAIDDAGLLQGISAHYFSGDPVSRSDAREVAQAWGPWSSVASWLLWQSQATLPMGLEQN